MNDTANRENLVTSNPRGHDREISSAQYANCMKFRYWISLKRLAVFRDPSSRTSLKREEAT